LAPRLTPRGALASTRACAPQATFARLVKLRNIIAADRRHGNVPMATGDTEQAAAVGHRP